MNLLQDKKNKGSGLGVIIYGITLMLILVFTAINIVNGKVIENGYNSLRDAVQSASSGAVMHLLTSERKEKEGLSSAQGAVITERKYDIYLQLALGYLINRSNNSTKTSVQSGEINNFIKLDHQKVVNSTMSLLQDSVYRNRTNNITNTDKYKILMIFIEPHYDNTNYEKYFDIIVYGNGAESWNGSKVIAKETAIGGARGSDMRDVYNNLQDSVNNLIRKIYPITGEKDNFTINLNPNNESLPGLVRKMETMPYYLIVVKDFALPTIFTDEAGNDEETSVGAKIVQSPFKALSGDGKLKTPICALNSGKTERQYEDAGWSHNR